MSDSKAPGLVFVVVGPPGSGKGTVAEWLAKHLRRSGRVAHAISSGQLMRDYKDPAVTEDMNLGHIADPKVFKRLLAEAIGSCPLEDILVLDGVARGSGEPKWLMDYLKWMGRSVTCVIKLRADRASCESRTRDRGRPDDDPAGQDERWRCYLEETVPATEAYEDAGVRFVRVDADGEPDQVAADVLTGLSRLGIL